MDYMDSMVSYARAMVGLPYRWGGDDTINGFDCSGLVQEILASYGCDPKGDQTAEALYHYFSENGCRYDWPSKGALAFYGSEDRITHVGFCIDDFAMVEAGGGGSNVRTVEDAAKHNAYVRIRPVYGRKGLVAIIMPHYRFV